MTMLDKNIKEKLKEMRIATEDIERAERILAQYNSINREFTVKLYDYRETRRAMKARGLWNTEPGIPMEEKYLGEGKCEVVRQKLWANYGKVRIYFDVLVDGEILSRNHYIVII